MERTNAWLAKQALRHEAWWDLLPTVR
jgi:hypothetical protein